MWGQIYSSVASESSLIATCQRKSVQLLLGAMVTSTLLFDIAADGEPLNHISFKLFAESVPKAVENIHVLNTEQKGFGYKNFSFHKIIPGFI